MANAELGTLWDVGTLAGLDDGALLDRFADRLDEGRDLAFEVLVRRHGPMVLRVCGQLLGDRHAAEDAFQAVFVILARKARSIRNPEQLGPWLHGVALRTAREARKREDKRRRLELRGATMPRADSNPPEHHLVRTEEAEALHREIARLPERYRSPVVLCDLEGLTQQEAANRLRCPLGTLAIRLKRARERLRGRLDRRGLDPSTGLSSLVLAPNASPILTNSLIESTVRASTAAGVASTSVVSLAEGVLLTMTWAKGKLAMAGAGLVLTLGLATWAAPIERQPGTSGDDIPEVEVARPVTREVTDFEDFNGVTEYSKSLPIRPQVAGTLKAIQVQLGQRVKAGDPMFELDGTSYQSDLDIAEATARKFKAQVSLAASVVARNKALLAKNNNYVSQDEILKADGELEVAKAELEVAEASRDKAKRIVEFTRIKAPFDGIVGDRDAVEGNMYEAGQVLARLVVIDPFVVEFRIDERTLLKLRRSKQEELRQGQIDLPIQVIPSFLQGLDLRGQVRFGGEPLDPETGTALFRATLPNPGPIRAKQLVKVRIITGPPHPALLVPDRAISTVEGKKFLQVVDARNVVESRSVTLGTMHEGFREIREGLKADDRVIVGNVKEIRPGMTIKPRPSPAP